MRKYPQVAGVPFGEVIGANLSSTNQYLPARADGRFYLAGGYHFACWMPLGAPTSILFSDMKEAQTNFMGFQVTTNGVTQYGWVRVYFGEGMLTFQNSEVVLHPEPGVSIQAGIKPVPTAKVRYLARSVEISWHPVWGEDWKLEASPSLATNATWSAVTGVVSNRVEMATLGSQRFFRLRKNEP